MSLAISRSDQMPLLAGVELGGTKCVCLVGTGPGDIRAQQSIPTTDDPDRTLTHIARVFDDWRRDFGPASALGVASFGPIDLDPASQVFGCITTTSKPGWSGADVAGRLARALGLPMAVDTDVNGAALAEGTWGAARGVDDFAYVTVGTGVGVGLVAGGRTVKGFGHPELGHIRVPRLPGDEWPGCCPFHGDCVEGLASGRAISQRMGRAGDDVAPEDAVWDGVVHALSQLLHVVVLATAPKQILMGGGVVTGNPQLFPRLRASLAASLCGYVDPFDRGGSARSYIAPPALGDLAGPLGALAVAATAAGAERPGAHSSPPRHPAR